MKDRVKEVFLFTTGFVCVFNHDGEQIPELQRKPLLELWLELAEKAGYDVSLVRINFNGGSFFPRKDSDGVWHLEIQPPR